VTAHDRIGQAGLLPRPLRAALFDLDDTLYPERQFVDGGFRAVARFLAKSLAGSEGALADRLWALHARDGRGRLFDTLLAELGVDDDPDLVLSCLLIYRTHQTALQPFPGVDAMLERLRSAGVGTGVVSDGHAAVQRRKLAGLGAIADRLDLVVMTDELGQAYAKPSPVPFRVACRLLDVPPSLTTYVGNDPRKDFLGARDAGLHTIRLGPLPDEGGTMAVEVKAADDADRTVGSFAELSAVLERAPTPVDDRQVATR
jgi:putative hydrolase of the HAD superfamily